MHGFSLLIDSSSSALSSQHPQTLRFFPREVKKSNTIDIFLNASNPHETIIRTREKFAELAATRGGYLSKINRV
jgi:hypothetical protein